MSAPLLGIAVLPSACSGGVSGLFCTLARNASCNWLVSADCDGGVLCLDIGQISLQNGPFPPGRQSCFPSTLLAISVAFDMPAPGGRFLFRP